MKRNIGDSEDITITRSESNFDRACDSAYRLAVMLFGIDEDGHSDCVQGWDRSRCWIEIRFVEYIRMGSSHQYDFVAATKKETDNE